MSDLKKKWEDLPPHEEEKYLVKARYLVERNYVLGKTAEQLAKEMFLKETTEYK